MSGGSYNYICFTLENECEGRMYDAELNDMVKDFAEVLTKKICAELSADAREYDTKGITAR